MSLTPEWQQRLIRLVEIAIGVTILVAALSLWRWYEEGGGFEVIYVVIVAALTGLWAVRRWLQPAAAAAPTSSPSAWGMVSVATDESLISLRQQLEKVLTLDDLRLLAFHLNLNYDNLARETLTRKILSLLQWCGANGRFPDLITYLQATYPRQEWAQPTLPALTAHPRGQRNRENLLNHIQTTWIDGFLKQSIHSEVLKLALNYRPEAVGQRPWQLVLQQTGQADQPVPPHRSILDIFNSSGRNLLILGAPGSGKTITMLQLAEALIASARTNPAEPMPIVLNLSSWAREKRPLTEWLVEEMFVQYGVARDLTRAGVADNLFLYLLDGLDEVANEARADCLAAINQFKEAYPAEMVVCSRIEEYEALERTLHLGAAVVIRPLSDEQVQSYITQEGLELQAVRATLSQDSDLRELARAPLMLSLITLAYRGLSRADLQPLADKEARRRHLFDHYVRQMFVRRPLPADTPYTKEQARQWLVQLAKTMHVRGQSTFFIEQLQPELLPKLIRTLIYPFLVSLITLGIFVVLALLATALLPMSALLNHWGMGNILDKFFLGENAAIAAGMVPQGFSLNDMASHRFALITFSSYMLLGWIFSSVNSLTSLKPIRLVENIKWSWREAIYSLPLLLIFSYLSALFLSTPTDITISELSPIPLSLPLLSTFTLVLFVTIFVIIASALWLQIEAASFLAKWPAYKRWFSFGISVTEINETKKPNEGIHRTARKGFKAMLLIGVVSGMSLTLYAILVFHPITLTQPGANETTTLLNFVIGVLISSIAYTIFLTVFWGSLFGLIFGFNTCIKHYSLRILLAANGMFPWRIERFLDAMHQRILLHRVGGGWIFIHRSLLEYFAGVAAPPSSANKDK